MFFVKQTQEISVLVVEVYTMTKAVKTEQHPLGPIGRTRSCSQDVPGRIGSAAGKEGGVNGHDATAQGPLPGLTFLAPITPEDCLNKKALRSFQLHLSTFNLNLISLSFVPWVFLPITFFHSCPRDSGQSFFDISHQISLARCKSPSFETQNTCATSSQLRRNRSRSTFHR